MSLSCDAHCPALSGWSFAAACSLFAVCSSSSFLCASSVLESSSLFRLERKSHMLCVMASTRLQRSHKLQRALGVRACLSKTDAVDSKGDALTVTLKDIHCELKVRAARVSAVSTAAVQTVQDLHMQAQGPRAMIQPEHSEVCCLLSTSAQARPSRCKDLGPRHGACVRNLTEAYLTHLRLCPTSPATGCSQLQKRSRCLRETTRTVHGKPAASSLTKAHFSVQADFATFQELVALGRWRCNTLQQLYANIVNLFPSCGTEHPNVENITDFWESAREKDVHLRAAGPGHGRVRGFCWCASC